MFIVSRLFLNFTNCTDCHLRWRNYWTGISTTNLKKQVKNLSVDIFMNFPEMNNKEINLQKINREPQRKLWALYMTIYNVSLYFSKFERTKGKVRKYYNQCYQTKKLSKLSQKAKKVVMLRQRLYGCSLLQQIFFFSRPHFCHSC